jgi:hypothetical protein
MKLVISKNKLEINKKICDLENFEESKFFQVLEEIVKNKKDLKIEKEDDITPLAAKFYEIISSEIENSNNEMEE